MGSGRACYLSFMVYTTVFILGGIVVQHSVKFDVLVSVGIFVPTTLYFCLQGIVFFLSVVFWLNPRRLGLALLVKYTYKRTPQRKR